jgi:hypothetical protein
MLAKAQEYTFMVEKREKKFAWMRFKEAVRHHKWMNTPVIGKLKMPRETKKAVQTLSDSLITREQIEQAVRRMHEAYSKPPRDHYVLIYSPKVVEMAKQQPDFEPLETYIKKIDKQYKGEVGRMRVLGRLCRIVEAGTIGREVGYVMRDDTLMYPDYLRGGQIK